MNPIRIVIVDDHPAIRSGVRSLLASAKDIEVVGEAATSDEALQATADLDPEVVVMDLRMPGVGGIETTRQLVRLKPNIAVLILTMVEDDASIFAAIRAGARGYLRKESGRDELVRALIAVAHGEFITSPGIAARVLAFFSRASSEQPTAFPALTEREWEVLDLIASGCNNQTIAQRLYLSPKTVRNYISAIFAKLHVADRAEAIVKARDAGLGRRSERSRTPECDTPD